MNLNNFAGYLPGTFTIDVTNFERGERLFNEKDMPAFIHEYCHYIQDISTISGIFGFSLWLMDLAKLTTIFCDGEDKIIMLPLPKGEDGLSVNQYRKFYNLFCGASDHVFELDYNTTKFKKICVEDKLLELTNWNPRIRFNKIIMENRLEPLHFRLIALQEIHAYYAQKLAETAYRKQGFSLEFSVSSDNLPSYPYRFGDHLFEFFKIEIPLNVKFILVGLCLDTIQAPSVFLQVVEAIKNRKFTDEQRSIQELIEIVDTVREDCSFSNDEALSQIMPDLERWAKDDRRPDLAFGLEWYITMVKLAYNFKKEHQIGFNKFFCNGIGGLVHLYKSFPAPVFYNNGALDGNGTVDGDVEQGLLYQVNYEAATSFYMLKRLYDFLCSPDITTLMNKAACPLFEHCTFRAVLNEDDICKRSPWQIVKGKEIIPCPYGRAAASMGLWQNSIDFKLDR